MKKLGVTGACVTKACCLLSDNCPKTLVTDQPDPAAKACYYRLYSPVRERFLTEVGGNSSLGDANPR
jgi:hypothetical protein